MQPKTARVLVIRHGETDWNAQNRVQGSSDIPLNDVGRRQAEEQAQNIKADVKTQNAIIFSSPLLRAKETAEIINKQLNLPLLTDSRLCEANFGELEGLDRATLVGGGMMMHYDAMGGEAMAALGVETTESLNARLTSFFTEIKGKYETVIIVAHGWIARGVKWYFEGREGNETHLPANLEISEYTL